MPSFFAMSDAPFKVEAPSDDEQRFANRVNVLLRPHRASVVPCREVAGSRDAETVMRVLEISHGPMRDRLRSPWPFVNEGEVVADVLRKIDARRADRSETSPDAAGNEFYREISALDAPDDWSGV